MSDKLEKELFPGLTDEVMQSIYDLPPMPDFDPDPDDELKYPSISTPLVASVRPWAAPIEEQYMGACGAYAADQVLFTHINRMLSGTKDPTIVRISKGALYAEARKIMRTFPQDSGVTLPALGRVLVDKGCIPDYVFPEVRDPTISPPDYDLRINIRGWKRVAGTGLELLRNAKALIQEEGLALVGGFRIPRDQTQNRYIMGTGKFQNAPNGDFDFYGHAMPLHEITENDGVWMPNSWGTRVGRAGWFRAPRQWFETPNVVIGIYSIDPRGA